MSTFIVVICFFDSHSSSIIAFKIILLQYSYNLVIQFIDFIVMAGALASMKLKVSSLITKTRALRVAKPVYSLLELSLRYLSRNLHRDIITYGLFLLPKPHLTAIRDKMTAINLNCSFTELIIDSAVNGDYSSLPKWNWDEWCDDVVSKATEVIKCAVITCYKSQVTEFKYSKNFAITAEEVNTINQVVKPSDFQGSSLTLEGRKYILFSSHPTMIFGDLLEVDNLTEEGQSKPNALDSSCIIASVDINTEQRMLVVALSSFNNSLIPNILSLQKLAEELTHQCKYIAEYFAYINGESPHAASNKFV